METKKQGYPKGFWICGCTEIFERLAYYFINLNFRNSNSC